MWDPFEDMKKFQKEMDKTFKKFFVIPERSLTRFSGFRKPLSDIKEDKKNITAKIELPGVEKKDIQLKIMENSIEVKAQKKQESEIKKKGFYRQERKYSGFYRLIPLPHTIKPDKAESEYKNGILTITAPKQKVLGNKKSKYLRIK